MLFVTGPGHGGPALVANAYLEGTYSELYPDVSLDTEGMKELFKRFSFPGGISSHTGPKTPGSIHEGGELGYALSHAFGAAFDNPDLIVTCIDEFKKDPERYIKKIEEEQTESEEEIGKEVSEHEGMEGMHGDHPH